MELIIAWWEIVSQLQKAFSRRQTFYWAATMIMGFSIRDDFLGGVTSFVRILGINPKHYQSMLHFFESSAVKINKLVLCWVEIVIKFFAPFIVLFNERPVFIIDGIAISKEGVLMPGVQSLHQSSESNSKAEYIMGHFFQCVGILAGTPGWETIFSVPLFGKIHLGTKTTNRDKRTLYDKAVEALSLYLGKRKFYLVGDAYYSVGKMVKGVVSMGGDIIVKIRSNAVAYLPPEVSKAVTRGRNKIYGIKVKLSDLFCDRSKFIPLESPIYGEKGVEVLVRTEQFLSRRFGDMLLLFVFVIHPSRGKMILLSTDLSLSASDVIQLYGLRFKIEVAFKSAIYNVGAFLYRFWMKDMDKTKRKQKTKYLHKKSRVYREKYFKKIGAYEIYVQLAFIAQGILQYLSMAKRKDVLNNFGSWFRTLRPSVLPSELVVRKALKNCADHFLKGSVLTPNLEKFIRKRLDSETKHGLSPTG